MAVRSLKSEDGSLRKFKVKASTTIVANTFVTLDATGFLIPAVAGTTELLIYAREGVVAGAGQNPEILCELLTEGVDLVVDTATEPTQANVGTKIDLTDAAIANLAATTTKVLRVLAIHGNPADKKIIARVVSKIA